MFDLAEAPEVRIDRDDHAPFIVRDETRLTIYWTYSDELVIEPELIGSGLQFHARIRRKAEKYEVSGLSQHVNLWLECGGRRFAPIEWEWSVGREPEPIQEVFATPLLSHPEKLKVEPEESATRLRTLFRTGLGLMETIGLIDAPKLPPV